MPRAGKTEIERAKFVTATLETTPSPISADWEGQGDFEPDDRDNTLTGVATCIARRCVRSAGRAHIKLLGTATATRGYDLMCYVASNLSMSGLDAERECLDSLRGSRDHKLNTI